MTTTAGHTSLRPRCWRCGRMLALELAWDATTRVSFVNHALQIGTISADWSVEKWEAVAPAVFDGIPMEVAIFLNRSSLAFDPGITRVAQAFLYASRLHIYSGTGENLATVAGPEEIPLSYRTEQVGPRERFLHNPDSRWAYTDVAASRDHIFAVFSGRDEATHPLTMNRGKRIHVFAWTGRYLTTLGLPTAARAIAVDPAGRWLYAEQEVPFPSVVQYELDRTSYGWVKR